MKKVLTDSIEVMGWIFILLIIGSFFHSLLTLTLANKIYLLIFWIAVLIGNTIRFVKSH
jgi:hypothetical protein